LDSSSNNLSVSVVNDAKISTTVATPFSPTVPSDGVLAFDATVDYLAVQDSSEFEFGAGNFTIEYWAYFNDLTNSQNHITKRDRSIGINFAPFYLGNNASNNMRFFASSNGSSWDVASNLSFGSLTINKWYHIALVRNGSEFTGYVDGKGTFLTTSSASLVNNSASLIVGSDTNATGGYNGYISNLRITKGVARYTENFDVPTAPFPILSPSGRVTIADESLDADARQYIINVEEQDGEELEAGVRTAINDFVVGCKSDGIWNAIKASCFLCGARTLEGALVPLKGGAPTNFNFTPSDYDRKTGLLGNGSYLNANRLGNADQTNDEHQSVYVSTSATGSGYPQYICSFDGTTTRNIAWNSGLGAYVYANTTTVGANSGGGSPTGLIGHSRDNASTYDFYVNNTLTADINQGSSAAPNIDTLIFSINDGTNKSNGRIAFYSIGESLDLAKLDTRISNFITAIGVAI